MQCSPDVVRYREDLSCQCAAWCFGLEAALLQVLSAALASLFQCLALHTPSFSVSYSPKIVSIPPKSSDDLNSFVNRSTTGIEKKMSSLGKTEEKFSRRSSGSTISTRVLTAEPNLFDTLCNHSPYSVHLLINIKQSELPHFQFETSIYKRFLTFIVYIQRKTFQQESKNLDKSLSFE
jgi:hypothetical protein